MHRWFEGRPAKPHFEREERSVVAHLRDSHAVALTDENRLGQRASVSLEMRSRGAIEAYVPFSSPSRRAPHCRIERSTRCVATWQRGAITPGLCQASRNLRQARLAM